MTSDTNLSSLVINKLTRAQYDSATKSSTELYLVTDESGAEVTDVKVNGTSVVSDGVASVTVPTDSEIDAKVATKSATASQDADGTVHVRQGADEESSEDVFTLSAEVVDE